MTSELFSRIISGSLIGAVIIGATLLGQITTSLLILVIITGSAYEFFRMQLPERTYRELYFSTALCVLPLIFLSIYLCLPDDTRSGVPLLIADFASISIITFTVLCILYFIAQLRSDPQVIVQRSYSFSTALLLFTAGGMIALNLCAMTSHLILGVFILLWSSDVFAYFGGRAFGRHKLAPNISPGKTWEGFFCGLAATVLIGAGLSFFWVETSMVAWIITGLIVVVFGTVGDLLQSAVKRSVGLKDSGRLLPGHGGMWDRFDSFVGCLPWIGLYYFVF